MVRPPRPLSHALHADLVILDEFGRALLPRPHRVHHREEPRATTILDATFGKPRAKTSCARSMRPDRPLPRSSQQVMLFQRRHTRVLGAGLSAKDKILALLYGSPGALSVRDIAGSIEYKNTSQLRQKVLK